MLVEDGKGKGFSAGVSGSNRLLVNAEVASLNEHGTLLGRTYDADLGVVTLTSAAESGVFYLQNNDPDRPLQLTRVIAGAGPSTGAAGLSVLLRVYANPTGGTLIAGPGNTVVTPFNRNFGTSQPAVVTARGGATGLTITGGTRIATINLRDNLPFAVFGTELVLPVSTSVAFSIQPGTANTSMAITFVPIFVYLVPDEF